jgi:hypothetical protein
MGHNGEAPAEGRGLPLSAKAQEVLDDLERLHKAGNGPQVDYAGTTHALTALLNDLYQPALAVAAAINHVRQGNTGMAPFIGAAGVVLSQALEPLVEHFNDGQTTFEEVFERIGIPVVKYGDLPDVPNVETPAADLTEEEEDAILQREDAESPGESVRPIFTAEDDAEAAAEEATWD